MTERRTEFEEWGRKGYVPPVFEAKTGGFVVIHPWHEKNEWAQIAQIARRLARKGDAVILIPLLKKKPSFDALRIQDRRCGRARSVVGGLIGKRGVFKKFCAVISWRVSGQQKIRLQNPCFPAKSMAFLTRFACRIAVKNL